MTVQIDRTCYLRDTRYGAISPEFSLPEAGRKVMSMDIHVVSVWITTIAAAITILSFAVSKLKHPRLEKPRAWFQQNSSFVWVLLLFSGSVALSTWYNNQFEERFRTHEQAALLALEATQEFANGSYSRSRELLINALEVDPDSPYILKRLADSESKLRRFEEALEHYRQATELQSEYLEAYAGQVIALYNLGRFDEAIGIWESRIQPRQPESAALLYVGGMAYSLEWDEIGLYDDDDLYQKALALYQECQKKESSWTPWCYYNEACLLARRVEYSIREGEGASKIGRLTDTALTRLDAAAEKAEKLNPAISKQLAAFICRDATLASIRERVDSKFCPSQAQEPL